MRSKNFGIVALILGIIGFFTFCIPIVGAIIAFIGVIFGIISTTRAFNTNENKGLPITGLTISFLAFVLAILFNIGAKKFWNNNNNNNNNNNFNLFNDSNYIENFDDIDTNSFDLDSALLNNKDFNNIDNSKQDFENGPGNPPN